MRRCRRNTRRASALYVTVLSTALIVSLLGLAGLTLLRIERRRMAVGTERRDARDNARSAVELALRAIADDADWRTTYANGVESPAMTLGPNATGTVSWIFEDSDGSLTDADTDLRLRGIGRVGDTVQVSSVSLAIPVTTVGPAELRSMTSTSSSSEDEVLSDKLWCQYLKPTLPLEATGWWITSVEFYCQRDRNNKTLDIRVYQPLTSNWPSSTVIDQMSVNSSSLSTSWGWKSFALTGTYSLAPGDGVCIAVMTNSSSAPIRISYRSGGVSEPDSAMIQGDPGWKSYETDKALRYRVNGVYTTGSGGVAVVAGSWVWDVSP